MIVPSMNDEQIVQELIDEHKSMQKFAKKFAAKELKKLQKKSIPVTSEKYFLFTINGISEKGNNFCLQVRIHKTGLANYTWSHMIIAESEYKNKDYYLLRGLSNSKPYYVKLSSHVIRRMHERLYKGKNEFDVSSILIFFEEKEIGVATKFLPIEFLNLFATPEDVIQLDDAQWIVMFLNGIFFAKRSNGNFHCKTSIGMDETMATIERLKEGKDPHKEDEVTHILNLTCAIAFLNHEKYDKEYLMNRIDYLKSTGQKPGMPIEHENAFVYLRP